MSDSEPSKVEAAHAYRSRGWRVIQLHALGPDNLTCSCRKGRNCSSKGKHPIADAWQSAAPMSGADIEAAWDSRPRANVGLATGRESGFWVLDVDPEHGGLDSAKRLAAEHGKVDAGYVVRTGSGGWHFYFAMPDFDVTNSPGRLKADYPGIDVRGTGGQVVAPPSRTDKGGYTVHRDGEIGQAPAWLLDLIRPQNPVGPVVTSSDVPDRSNLDAAEIERLDRYTERAVRANLDRLSQLAAKGWDGEPWNHTTFEVSCALLELANSPWNAYTTQQAYDDVFRGAPRDSEGFDDATVNKTFGSAVNKVGEKARPVPAGRPSNDDDFFSGPDVRVDPRLQGASPDPTHGGGDDDDPAARFFGEKGGLNVTVLAQAVTEISPLAYGGDNAFWTYHNGVWKSDPKAVRARVAWLLGDKFRTGHASNVSEWLEHDVRQLDCGPVEGYVNFRNGMLDWRTGELLAHDPHFESTVQMSTDYDPEATCPHFEEWLDSVLEPDYIDLVWEMLGYLMYSGNPLQVAFMLYGSGGNGKGTLIRVIKDLLGPGSYAGESLDDLNGNRFSAVNLFGKTANLAGDIDATYQESTANFKKLTGEDLYAAERKFGDRFNFVSWAVPVFSANKIPGSSDVTEGYLRRWVIIHFTRRIENPILSLSDRLVEELPGIAAKAIRALQVLMERQRFEPTGEARRGKEIFAQQIDQVRQWVTEGAIEAPEHFESRDALYDSYRLWADRNGHGRLKAPEFAHRLEAIGYPPTHRGLDGYVGLRVLSVNQRSTSDAFFGSV